MNRLRFWKKTASMLTLMILGSAFVPFASQAEQNIAVQDDWNRNFSSIESILNGISSSEQTPSQTNRTRYTQTMVTTYPKSSGTSNTGNVYARSSSTASSNRTSVENGGPGSSNISNKMDDSDQKVGPTVTDVSLSETYYEDYDIYCLSIQDLYYFYSTIGNNGITDQTVSVDIPANISYSVTKDGMPMEYTSKQPISENGTYIFRITVTKNPEDSVSKQNIIRTNYHFRIQPKAVKPKEETVQAQQSTQYNSYLPENYLGNLQVSGQNSSQDSYSFGSTAGDSTIDPTLSQEEPWNQTEMGNESLDTLLSQDTSQEETESGEQTESDVSEKQTLDYDYEQGLYVIPFADGSRLLATLPNGMMTNYDVTLHTKELPETVRFLKNGESCPIPEDGMVHDPGSYELLVPFGDQVSSYSFRILGNAESNLDYYTVPESVTLNELYVDGILQDSKGYTDQNGVQRVHFAKDGVYRLVMQDELGAVFDCELIRDAEPPVVTVEVLKGSAQIHYENPSEIEKVVLRSGKKEETLSAITQVTKAGKYVMEVYDHAGNHTTVSFRVRGSINIATVVSLVMLCGIAVAFAVLFIRTKKDGKVS